MSENTSKVGRLEKVVSVLGEAGEKGLTSKQLGSKLGIGEKSVAVYISQARKTLPENQAIQKVMRGGGATKHRYYRLAQ